MELSKQVCSLEISQRLKELGVKQESLIYWVGDDSFYRLVTAYEEIGEWYQDDDFSPKSASAFTCLEEYKNGELADDCFIFSAFTVAELGEILPIGLALIHWGKKDGGHIISYQKNAWEEPHRFEGNTEADARGKTLVYLLESNLLSLSK